jgi:hypothetical protein
MPIYFITHQKNLSPSNFAPIIPEFCPESRLPGNILSGTQGAGCFLPLFYLYPQFPFAIKETRIELADTRVLSANADEAHSK